MPYKAPSEVICKRLACTVSTEYKELPEVHFGLEPDNTRKHIPNPLAFRVLRYVTVHDGIHVARELSQLSCVNGSMRTLPHNLECRAEWPSAACIFICRARNIQGQVGFAWDTMPSKMSKVHGRKAFH